MVVAAAVSLAALAVACSERLTAPGSCPDFCPPGTLELVDTLLFPIDPGTDSAFRGYVTPHEASLLQVANAGDTVRARGVIQFGALPDSVRRSGDTTLRRVAGLDSVRLQLNLFRRDTIAEGLRLDVYRLPRGRDSTDTFAGLDAEFVAANLITTIVVDSALPADTTTGQRRVTGTLATVVLGSAVPFAPEDSGVLAIGVSAVADTGVALALLRAVEAGGGPAVSYFVQADSADTTVAATFAPDPSSVFDTFVVDPTSGLPLGLEAGGMPTARSILRFVIPGSIVDTSQVVRATLILVPLEPADGVPGDSFFVVAHAVAADFGAKSPLAPDPDSVRQALVRMAPGEADTVRMEMTRVFRFWRLDPDAPRTVMLLVRPEGATLGRVRFGSSAMAGARPAIRISFFRPFGFGGR